MKLCADPQCQACVNVHQAIEIENLKGELRAYKNLFDYASGSLGDAISQRDHFAKKLRSQENELSWYRIQAFVARLVDL